MRILITIFLSTFVSLSAQEKSPIDFAITKVKKGAYKLAFVVPKGYAIQKDAPNKIELTGENGLKVTKFKSEFKGPIKIDKPEYFDKVEDLKINVSGTGDLVIDSKIFYCDLNKNLCYPAKINKREKLL